MDTNRQPLMSTEFVMQVSHRSEQSIDIVKISGRLTMADTDKVREITSPLIEQHRYLLIFDLTDLEFVDSSGLAVFISVMKQLRNAGGDVVLCGVQKTVRTVFQLTRLHQVIDLFDSYQQAVDKLQSVAKA
jgi:anti-sigma B factor antagonist